MTEEFTTAAQARKWLKERSVAVKSIKGERSPWSSTRFFVVTLQRNGHRVVSKGGAGIPWTYFSDDPATAALYNNTEALIKGTNIILA